MKNNNYSAYGTFTSEKINAPKGKPKCQPKVTKITGKSDLRDRIKK